MSQGPVETVDADVAIIGAGIVGLAIAEAVTRQNPELSVVVLERHFKFGQEASSHNSEVIHAGIYYSPGSYKAKSCINGKRLLYEFCSRYGVAFNRCGKYIIASDHSQIPALMKIAANSAENGVVLQTLDRAEIRSRIEIPTLEAALWSESSGIVDSHMVMDKLLHLSLERGALVLFNHGFVQLENASDSHVTFEALTSAGERMKIRARMFVNSAGIAATQIARQFGGGDLYKHRICRGRYFSLSSQWRNRFPSLIYPLPDPRGGLGIHLTLNLAGDGRLGPDVDWSHADSPHPDAMIHYQFDDAWQALRDDFFEAGRKFLPGLVREDLNPDYVGVRAKLFKNGEATPDFLLTDLGQGGAHLHLLGIESPGVTSALSLAEDVAVLVKTRLG